MDMLKKLRDRIDWLDCQIASMLNERMRAADQVGKLKRSSQLNVTDQSREKKVLDQVESLVQHPVLKANISNIYMEIMKESRTAQQFFQSLSMPFQRVGIIGLGLIGGSICKGIKMKDPAIEISALAYPSPDNILAKEGGWIDKEYASISELMQNSDVVILASPISTIIPLAEEIKRNSDQIEKLLVIDLASVKENIVEAFEKLSVSKVEYVGTHPMAGKESKGFANSQATLFVNRPWVVVPHRKNSKEGIQQAQEFIRYLGAESMLLHASVHDHQAALISHIPSMLAKSYLDFVIALNPESMRIAGPGFQAFTRLAHDNPAMRSEIATSNQKVIKELMDQWLEYLQNKG